MKLKFNIGQTVRIKADGEVGVIVGVSSVEASEEQNATWRYKLTSQEVDVKAKKIVDGFKHCLEAELEEANEE